MNHLQFHSSVGTIAVTWNSQGCLTRMDWYESAPRQTSNERSWSALASKAFPPIMLDWMERFERYFEHGEPMGELPWEFIDQRGWSDFQIAVYQQIARIPHGETRTYAWVSKRLGKFAAPRAVGQALRRNPLPILIPCHRIVSATALGGFMGMTDPDQPELRLKQKLIDLENQYVNPVFDFWSPVLTAAG